MLTVHLQENVYVLHVVEQHQVILCSALLFVKRKTEIMQQTYLAMQLTTKAVAVVVVLQIHVMLALLMQIVK